MELIDRKQAIKAIKSYSRNSSAIYVKTAVELLKKLPEVNRPKGKWHIESGIGCYCSNCDFDISNDFDYMEYVNYCPHCGADMRGEE